MCPPTATMPSVWLAGASVTAPLPPSAGARTIMGTSTRARPDAGTTTSAEPCATTWPSRMPSRSKVTRPLTSARSRAANCAGSVTRGVTGPVDPVSAAPPALVVTETRI